MKSFLFLILFIFISFVVTAQVSPAERTIKMKTVFVENYTLDHKSKAKFSDPDKKNALVMASVEKAKVSEYHLFEDTKFWSEVLSARLILEKNKSLKKKKE